MKPTGHTVCQKKLSEKGGNNILDKCELKTCLFLFQLSLREIVLK